MDKPKLFEPKAHVEAMKLTKFNKDKLAKWCGGKVYEVGKDVFIKFPSNNLRVAVFPGEWVVKIGSRTICMTDEAFNKTYQEAKEAK